MKNFFTFLLLIFSVALTAQRVKVISGDYNFLKGEKFLKIVFKFEGVTFERKNFTEEEFIAKRMNEIEDSKGKEEAEKWKTDWELTKTKIFPEKFLTSWNKNTRIEASTHFEKTKYTLIVEPKWIYMGAFMPLASDPSLLNSTMTFVETENPDRVLMVVEGIKATGDNGFGVPNHNDRMAECYAKTAKMLAMKVEHYTKK